MTSERDFDRIARAWLDIGPNEAPDRAIDAILDTIETIPQVRRPWRWPLWRSPTMTRVTMLAVLAGIIAIIVGGLALSGAGTGPSPSAVPSSSPAIASPSPGPIPDALVGGWVGAIDDNPEPARDTIAILFGALDGNALAPDFMVSGPASTPNLRSTVEAPEPGVISLALEGASPNCSKDDVGTYRWSISADGQWLTTELIEDTCTDRSDVLPGAWQRSLGVDSHGGPGIVTNFLPYLQFTLPAGTYVANGATETDTINIDSPGYSFKVWKDLDGFVDPCDIDAGRLDLDPGMDGFLAYLTGDPRFTVTSQDEFQIDGHRAVEVQYTIGDSITAPCWDLDGNPADKTGVLTWNPHASSGGFWNAPIGGLGMVVVTEVDGTSLVFEPVKDSGDTWVIDREVLSTVRFLDALPTPPASS
jgi:hypothetical protein